jgi:hypothetical protein
MLLHHTVSHFFQIYLNTTFPPTLGLTSCPLLSVFRLNFGKVYASLIFPPVLKYMSWLSSPPWSYQPHSMSWLSYPTRLYQPHNTWLRNANCQVPLHVISPLSCCIPFRRSKYSSRQKNSHTPSIYVLVLQHPCTSDTFDCEYVIIA